MQKNRKKNKAIWLFAGGNMQEKAARKIKELGYMLIITDRNKDCFCAKYADKIVSIDTFDLKGNLDAASEIKKKYDIKATFTQGADCHEAAAVVADFLGIHGIDPKISHNCRFKLNTREILTKAGIPQPKFQKVTTLEELKIALRKIGIPAIIKSSDNAGSRGLSMIENFEDATESVLKCAIENGSTGYAILEERINPVTDEIAEQSLETVWYDGKMYWLNWVDRPFRKDFLFFDFLKKEKMYKNLSWGVELGHINPGLHNKKITKEVQEMVYATGCAFGLNKQKGGHIFKCDTMLTAKGPYILEATMRLSGGWDSSWSTPSRGGDFIGGALHLALGGKLDLDSWNRYFQYKDPNSHCSILAWIPKNVKDCIGRKFAAGNGFTRYEAMKDAYRNVLKRKFISDIIN